MPGSSYLPPGFGDGDDFYPVDFLEGRMDLKVVLPSAKAVHMSVERR